MSTITCAPKGALTLERILFGLAAVIVLAGTLLAVTVSHWFAALPLFVVANMLLYAVAGDCPSSMLLRSLLGIERRAAGDDVRPAGPPAEVRA